MNMNTRGTTTTKEIQIGHMGWFNPPTRDAAHSCVVGITFPSAQVRLGPAMLESRITLLVVEVVVAVVVLVVVPVAVLVELGTDEVVGVVDNQSAMPGMLDRLTTVVKDGPSGPAAMFKVVVVTFALPV